MVSILNTNTAQYLNKSGLELMVKWLLWKRHANAPFRLLENWHQILHAVTGVSFQKSSGLSRMDVLEVPQKREDGWYLSLMAPNTKGPKFAWLDPSRLYCNSQVNNHSVARKTSNVQGTLLNNLALKYVSWGLEDKLRIGWQPWALKFKVSELSFFCYSWLIQALSDCVKDLLKPFQNETIDLVAGIDAMGFILGIKLSLL